MCADAIILVFFKKKKNFLSIKDRSTKPSALLNSDFMILKIKKRCILCAAIEGEFKSFSSFLKLNWKIANYQQYPR